MCPIPAFTTKGLKTVAMEALLWKLSRNVLFRSQHHELKLV